ncbi:unnamed protein product, partial [Meganyctiphanes norvegica]
EVNYGCHCNGCCDPPVVATSIAASTTASANAAATGAETTSVASTTGAIESASSAKAPCTKTFAGITADPANCGKYFRCWYSVVPTDHYTCPGGQLYNPATQACDWKVNVDCGSRPKP